MADLEKFQRLIKRYPEVFRGKSFNYSTFKSVFDKINTSSRLCVFYYDKDIAHYIVMAMVIKSGKYLDINFMSVYELIDIYLGHIEEYSCLSAITNEIIAVYDSVGIPNKQKGNIITQVMEQQRMTGRRFWLLFKGSESKLLAMYPEVATFISDNNVSSVKFKKSSTDYEEDIL